MVEPKTLMPDRFGKKNGPSWRTGKGLRWYGARGTETGDENGGEQENTDRCYKPPTRLWSDERGGPRTTTLLDLQD